LLTKIHSFIITSWCGNEDHDPSYGYIIMDDVKYDLCNIVKNLHPNKKEAIEEYDSVCVITRNNNVYLNDVFLNTKELSSLLLTRTRT
jgi:hypothetical protein